MIQLRTLSVAILVGGAMFSRPAEAQYGNVSQSQIHVVSVRIPPRVRVEMSRAAEGLALSVRGSQSWVLSMKSRASASAARDSNLRWSSSPRGEFTTMTSADTVLIAGKASPSPADTAVFFRAAQSTGAQANDDEAVVLTVTAP